MVAHEHPTGYSSEPQMMKEMSVGEEASSTKQALLEKRCNAFIDSLKDFPRLLEYENIMREFKREINIPSLAGKIEQLFEGHPELLAEFNHFLPEKYRVTPTLQPRVVCRQRKRRDDSASDSDVRQKWKRRDDIATDSDGGVDARAKDSEFRIVLRCGKQTRAKFRDEDKKSDDGHQKAPTLSPTTDPSDKAESDDDSDEAESTEYKLEKVIAFVNKVSDRFHNNSDVVKLFLDMVGSRKEPSDGYEQELELYKKIATLLEGEQDLIDEFTQFLTRVPRMDEIVDFPMLELCTPSYRLLPKTFPIPAATGRSKLASEVLNDRYICIDTSSSTSSSTSGGGGRRVNRKSQHEVDLLHWEDECMNFVCRKSK
ncbi:paired amphipathic helix protein Sin3-like 1 [Argentina anserina]|uniref:paired amphipathic helix protein Sin3-like 1 n=1 Tax=Argentina anserina TaxID=57926 RepID=UPI0021764756|nr:paired amphipathic helix protein Sin3-like 1 [Potentilla anserina]